MKQILTVIILALLTITPVRGEVLAKKKTIEPVAVDSLQLLLQAGDSCMKQSNTFEALQYFQQAYARCDSSLTRIKLADCYYKRGNYLQTANLLKNVPNGQFTHEALRQLDSRPDEKALGRIIRFATDELGLTLPEKPDTATLQTLSISGQADVSSFQNVMTSLLNRWRHIRTWSI